MGDARIFSRGTAPLPLAASGTGAWIVDAEGRRYLDAAGGAIVVGIGHGRARVADAAAAQMRRIASRACCDSARCWNSPAARRR